MMIKIIDVLSYLNTRHIRYKFSGDESRTFSTFCPLNSLKKDSITWVRNSDSLDVELLNSYSGIILVAEYDANIENNEFSVIYAENVHRTFFRIVAHFFGEMDPENRYPDIASTAIVESGNVGKNVYIGHHTYIGPDVIIGDNVQILNNVTIQGKVSIGNFSIIESGTTIGACGFGHYHDESGNPVCVPHFGGVVIGDYVKIGANNTISRGCLSDTIIEDYVKTDNLVHIAHNDHIKHGAMLTACVEISGSTTIGRDVWLAPGTTVREGVDIGDRVYTGIGAAVTKNQPGGKVVVGVPARILRDRRTDEGM